MFENPKKYDIDARQPARRRPDPVTIAIVAFALGVALGIVGLHQVLACLADVAAAAAQ